MNIILVSERLAKARTFTLGLPQMALLGLGLMVTVVYNDSSLSLIDAAQARRGLPTLGVRYGPVDFAAASAAPPWVMTGMSARWASS